MRDVRGLENLVDLWNQAIMESGSMFNSGVMSYDETTRDSSRQRAVLLGCATLDEWNGKKDVKVGRNPRQSQKIVECLKNKSGQDILAADDNIKHSQRWKWGYVQVRFGLSFMIFHLFW